MRVITRTAEETIAFGERLGSKIEPGDVLVLTGDLGAGKTQLAKGIARALGIDEAITSPTFTIQMVYRGRDLDLNHFDLYRLEHAGQLEDTGLFDALDSGSVCVIEWGEQFSDEIGDERLDVILTRLDGMADPGEEPPRAIELVPHGARAEKIVSHLA